MARFAEHELRVDEELAASRPDLRGYDGKRVILGIRPGDLEDAALEPDTPSRLSAGVDVREDMGSEVFVHFGVGAPPVRQEAVAAAVGEEAVEATVAHGRRNDAVFVARLDRESRVREQERVELAVNTRRLHFFDPETGNGIYAG